MVEMIFIEREYVRFLVYVIDNYFLEMERVDLFQDLLGKRGVIFGNLEKFRDFYCQYFFRELECCWYCLWVMGRSFLRYVSFFGYRFIQQISVWWAGVILVQWVQGGWFKCLYFRGFRLLSFRFRKCILNRILGFVNKQTYVGLMVLDILRLVLFDDILLRVTWY